MNLKTLAFSLGGAGILMSLVSISLNFKILCNQRKLAKQNQYIDGVFREMGMKEEILNTPF